MNVYESRIYSFLLLFLFQLFCKRATETDSDALQVEKRFTPQP